MVGLVALPLAHTAGLGYVKHTLDSRNESSRAALLAATPAQSRLRPVTEPNNAYASSKTCRACHPSEYNSWHNSYHRTMTQLAKPEAVLAKWHGIGLALGQATLQLEQKRDEFWVNTLGADGIKTGSQRVTMTTGSHHLQVYWTADAKGNLQHPFPYGWLIADQKWVPVQDTFLRDPQLTPPDAKWNNTCIKCHAVAGRPSVDPRTRTVKTPRRRNWASPAKPATARPGRTSPTTKIPPIVTQLISAKNRRTPFSTPAAKNSTTACRHKSAASATRTKARVRRKKSTGTKTARVFCPAKI